MKNKRSKLYSYKMTDDSGFAPNPYHGILTLATCKPRMRHNTQVGNWVAGFTSARMRQHPGRSGKVDLSDESDRETDV